MKVLFKILVFVFLNFQFLSAQSSVSIMELESQLAVNPKPVIIELYTDWCGICAIQQKKIRKDDALVSLLENKFYYVKFNAESQESFLFNGHLFENKNQKNHDFAEALLDEAAFPAWVILNPELEIIFRYNGLLEAKELILVLKQIL